MSFHVPGCQLFFFRQLLQPGEEITLLNVYKDQLSKPGAFRGAALLEDNERCLSSDQRNVKLPFYSYSLKQRNSASAKLYPPKRAKFVCYVSEAYISFCVMDGQIDG
ncbi:hypothetical protein Krac_9782 [Ktedonobacter racemifer DSM 44963]|uniref:Uncharacterized protein n=1 Tax=Ktedonobacter racemifer DSM 44963 TaxID=485913 RepID=D6TDJ5_KTERA|nr:hypothetical protein Krac_9782 [Ktedonobacter racemifer DSM 44963]